MKREVIFCIVIQSPPGQRVSDRWFQNDCDNPEQCRRGEDCKDHKGLQETEKVLSAFCATSKNPYNEQYSQYEICLHGIDVVRNAENRCRPTVIILQR